VADDGSQQRKPDFRTAVEDVKALATVFAMEAESVLGRRTARFLGLLVLVAVMVITLLALLNWYITPSSAEQKQALVVTVAQILGGAALLLGLYFTWRGQQNAQAQLELNRRGQITERFTQAIDQLGSKDLEIRLGGIYSLERTAYEDRDHHWPVMEVLTTYVRQHASQRLKTESSEEAPLAKFEGPKPDIQAILTVIGRRSKYHANSEVESGPIDLRATNLRGANLRGANLRGAILTASDLSIANLRGADLREATLYQTLLEGARLEDTRVQGTNLRMARGLKRIQIMRADGDNETKLPNDLSRPTKWDPQSPDPIG
jgi:hypothetical protein